MQRRNWLDVDMDGMRKVLERRGKQLAIYELVQNGWDEDATKIEIMLTRPQNGRSELVVSDDSPEGFRDLTDAYTMFAESCKKANPEKRGAFNIGEKYVLALCDEATITTTTGRVTFDKNGRRRTGHVKKERGSEFRGLLRLKIEEWETMCEAATMLIPPVSTFLNGEEIPPRTPLRKWTAVLATVKGDEEGNLRRTERQTTVSVYTVLPGESPMLYEMGIPVVEIDSKYHVSVGQKVLLNIDRDNVTPAYGSAVLVETLNHTVDLLTEEDAKATWVTVGADDERVTNEAITAVLDKRYGENRFSCDPNDPEAVKIAITKGAVIVHGSSMPSGMWENSRRAGAITPPPPSPKVHFSEFGKGPIDSSKWTEGMRNFAEFAQRFASVVIGKPISISFYSDDGGQGWQACYGGNSLKVAKKQCGGNKFFDGDFESCVFDWAELLIHELAHDKVSDHLSSEFHDECCRLGARYIEQLCRKSASAKAGHA
jgi:Histidine kinase-, DNA gyrase B-, and HSP90-like ATPase